MPMTLPLLISLGTVALACQADAGTPSVDTYISWLPSDTETIVVAKGPFRIEDLSPGAQLGLDRVRNWALSPFLASTIGAEAFEHLSGKTVELAVEGSRNFRFVPDTLGLMPYEGCHIVRFAGNVEPAFSSLGRLATEVTKIHGAPVATIERQQGLETWQVHFSLVEEDLLVIATDTAYLTEVLSRRQDGGESVALAAFPRWDRVDRSKPIWAVRQFAPANAASDPTNPLAPMTFSPADALAIGVTIEANESEVVVKYFSGAPEALEQQERLWKEEESSGVASIVAMDGLGALITLRTSTQEGGDLLELMLLSALGHAVLI